MNILTIINNKEKKNCCGCSACFAICPVDAIKMVEDEEGFLYPTVTADNCIDCGICKEVCPFEPNYKQKICNGNLKSEEQRDFWTVKSSDENVLRCSRSGGASFSVAEKIINRGGVVYGVLLDKDFKAKYSRAENKEEIYSFLGSKYVQASKTGVFKAIEKDLNDNREVLFVGTSCEVAGLKSYLKQKNVNENTLLTIDLICHGVPSPRIWGDNICYLESKWKTQIVNVDFRDKSLGWKSHIESYICRDGRKKYANIFTTLFYAHVMLRPSCHNCQFCNFDRVGDITIGDFWGSLQGSDTLMRKYSGTTQVMINTDKGKEYFLETTNIINYPISKEAFSYQPNLYRPTKVSNERDTFWKNYELYGYPNASKKYYSIKEKIKLPYNILKSIGKNIGK